MHNDVSQWRAESRKVLLPRLWIMLVLLLVSTVLGVTQGAIKIDLLSSLDALEKAVLLDIRLPRTLMTIATGAGLSICGLILQSLSRNPLADPGIIGVSAGAALFAAWAILLSSVLIIPGWLSLIFIPGMAFLGAALALFLLLMIAGYRQSINTLVLILAGVAINSGAITLLGLISYIADDDTLRVITFWQLGSYSGINWHQALMACTVVALAIYLFVKHAKAIMLLQVGEQQAAFQGIRVNRLKRILLVVVALVTAISVCFTGIVGFVGLVVPHICRMLVGHHLAILLPATAISGAALVTLADVLARLIIVPAELPIGLLTSALGVPFFIGLILREKRKFAHD